MADVWDIFHASAIFLNNILLFAFRRVIIIETQSNTELKIRLSDK